MKTTRVQAQYREIEDEQLEGNPFAEALPEMPNADEIYRRFQYRELSPDPGELEQMSDIERLKKLRKLENFRFPFSQLVRNAYDIIPIIENSYVGRNPLKNEDLARCREREKQSLTSQTYRESLDREETPETPTTRETKLIVGVSGMGKTTTVESILRLYPQVIEHESYRGEEFERKQIVYLKVECPPSGKIRDFADNILKAFDDALGEDSFYYDLYKDESPNAKLDRIGNLNDLFGVAVIFVDEIQHLAERKEGKILTRLITSIMNSWDTPFIFVGTPLAQNLYWTCFREGRRLSSDGLSSIDRLEEDSEEWRNLMLKLWDFQMTKNTTEWDEEFSRVFYELTQGILSLTIKLYKRVQAHVITDSSNEDEIITVRDVRETFMEDFSQVAPLIKAIRGNDKDKMRAFGDILIELDEMHQLSDELYENNRREHDKRKRAEKKKLLKNDLYGFLKSQDEFSGLNKKDVERIVRKVLQGNSDRLDDYPLLVSKCYMKAAMTAEEKKQKKKEKTAKRKKTARAREGIITANWRKVKEKKRAREILRSDGYLETREDIIELAAL